MHVRGISPFDPCAARGAGVSVAPQAHPEAGLTIIVRRREFEEYLESLIEIGRYSTEDARVTVALLDALRSVRGVARDAHFDARAAAIAEAAFAIGLTARDAMRSRRDIAAIEHALDGFRD